MAVTYISTLNINGSGLGELYVNGDVNISGTVCAGCFCGPGSGGGTGSSMWVDGTDPFIVPCNSCGICIGCLAMTGDVWSNNTSLGVASSPGAFDDVNAACGMFTTCLNTPVVCGTNCVRSPIVCGTSCLRGATVCVTSCIDGGASYASLAGLNVGGSSACVFYVSGNGIYSGTLDITYLDGTCVCASRRLRLPVGTNCY